ncbi:MAG: hypothetical protein HYU66_25910 [Armatimonadetes bacterium]|nr:hypothetical protein [Armatimonadota bacterium]
MGDDIHWVACRHCGEQRPSGGHFCTACGARVRPGGPFGPPAGKWLVAGLLALVLLPGAMLGAGCLVTGIAGFPVEPGNGILAVIGGLFLAIVVYSLVRLGRWVGSRPERRSGGRDAW